MDISEGINPARTVAGGRVSGNHFAALAILAYGLLHVAFLHSFTGDIELRGTIDSGLLTLGGILATACLGAAARRSAQRNDPATNAWKLLALAQLFYLIGDALWIVVDDILDVTPFPSIADGAYLAYYALALIATLQLVVRPLSRSERIKLWLDMGVVMVASTAAAWVGLFSPILSKAGGEYWTLLLSLLYPTLDLMLVWLLVIRLLSQQNPNQGVMLYALGLIVMTVADAAFSYENGTQAYVSGASPSDWLFPICLTLVALSGVLQFARAQAAAGVDAAQHSARLKRWSRRLQIGFGSGLSYFWVFVLFVTMTAEHAEGDTVSSISDFHIAAAALGVVIVLVLLRQSITIRDNTLLTERGERMLDISHILSAPVDVSQLPARVLEELNQLVPNDESYLVLRHDDGLSFHGVKTWAQSGQRSARIAVKPDLSALYRSNGPVALTEGVAPVLALDCAAMVLKVLHEGQLALWPNRTVLPMRHWSLAPLVSGGNPMGFMAVGYSDGQPLSTENFDMLAAYARTVVACIETSRLRQQQLSAVAAAERNRLSRDLHDSVLQAIYGAAMGVRTAEVHAKGKHKPISDALDYSINLIDGAISEMKALIFMLRPETLMSEGLLVALSKQAQALCKRHGIDTMVDAQCAEPALSIEAKEELYRIAIEAVQNTIKHARATRVSITTRMRGDAFVMTMTDNGIGFDTSRSYKDNLGLVSIRERAHHIGAAVVFESAAGAGTGTTITVSLRIARP